MARRTPRPRPSQTRTLAPVTVICPHCKRPTRADYTNFRTVSRLDGVLRLALRVRRCHTTDCPLRLRPYRPEAEGRLALPHHEFGLDVLALVGRLRHADHRSTTEIHQELVRRGLVLAQRTVTNVLDRYDELRALDATDPARFGDQLAGQSTVVLALDGLQPDVGHEVLWVLRDCVGGHILLARSLLSATQNDLAALLSEVRDALPIPISAVVSDGQHSIRKAVKKALPNATHQLCHFHYLREAARPIYEADRHAKKELKKRVRGIRKIEREVEGKADEESEVVRGYCAAVRSALTDDGRPPLVASGLKLLGRLRAIRAGLDRLRWRGALPARLARLHRLVVKGLAETESLWPGVERAYRWVWRVARLLGNETEQSGSEIRRRLRDSLRGMLRAARRDAELAAPLRHFVKVTRSYWPGLFGCYESPDVPRTNNDLEQLFGSYRYHERRSSGRRQASPGLVVRGSVRLVSGMLTRLKPGTELPSGPKTLADWRRLRAELGRRQEARRKQRRFRKDPATYLKQLENRLLKLGLPA
jgi:Transposase, Mutator family